MNFKVKKNLIDLKPQVQPQTTEKTTKKPKKSKRDADAPSKIFQTTIKKKLILMFLFF
jgi:hypothetical protein